MKGQAELWWGLLFGCVGLGYLVYGRRQGAAVPIVCGLALMVFPYFVPNTYVLVLIGGVLSALPYFLRR